MTSFIGQLEINQTKKQSLQGLPLLILIFEDKNMPYLTLNAVKTIYYALRRQFCNIEDGMSSPFRELTLLGLLWDLAVLLAKTILWQEGRRTSR